MNTFSPATVAAARTARLVREAQTPLYSTSTPTASQARMALLVRAERVACQSDYCHVCRRCTEHFGEHSEEQILTWAGTRRARLLMGGK